MKRRVVAQYTAWPPRSHALRGNARVRRSASRPLQGRAAERPDVRSHAERGNERGAAQWTTTKRRQAFTLVELMVSMALIIFIMAILSQAFIAALGVFRNLKGQGDLAEKLRSTMQILQRDLGAYHFEGNKRISDPTFWNNGPPQQGFFQVWHGSIPSAVPGNLSFDEGADADGIHSYRTINHAMAFTIRLAGNDMGDLLWASAAGSGNVWTPNPTPPPAFLPSVPQLPGGLGIGAIGSSVSPSPTFGPPESRYQPIVPVASVSGYSYQWGEVAWFLHPQLNLSNPSTPVQDFTVPDATTGVPAVPLFTLYRRQRLLVPDNNLVYLATPQPPGGVPNALIGYFAEMSCWTGPNGNIYFNSPVDITVPQRRFGYNAAGNRFPPSGFAAIPAGNGLSGSDIQLNDVVSFDIRVLPMVPGNPPPQVIDPFVTLWDAPFSTSFVPNPPPGTIGMVFDTWSSLNDGIHDYSKWNVAGGTATGPQIPFWTTLPLTYQYPGNLQTITTPKTGSGPIIKAIQVTIRIWDYKTNQTRQVTIVQAM